MSCKNLARKTKRGEIVEENKTETMTEQNAVKENVVEETVAKKPIVEESQGVAEEIAVQEKEVVENKQSTENLKKTKLKHRFYRCFLKRFFDIILSGMALILLSPVFLVLSILVRCKLGKPIIFRQARPGYKNRIFMFYKYRSMADLRDENGDLLPDEVRMTKFGKLLRATSLDELPQLWNIFKGDMSIVGPRPKLVKDMVFYDDYQNRRSLVRPGLTGLAQANGRNLNSWAETFDYDNNYVDNCSLWLDIKIIFKTAIKVIKKKEILTQDAVPDAYYFGEHLLNNNKISKEEFDEKIKFAKDLEKQVMSK